MSIEYFDIQALNRSTTGTFSYDSGSPVLQFAIGDVEKYLIGNSLRLAFDFKVFNTNGTQVTTEEEVELSASCGLHSCIQQLDISSYKSNLMLESIRNYGRCVSTLMNCGFCDDSELLDRGTNEGVCQSQRWNAQNVGIKVSGMDKSTNYTIPLYSGLLMSQPVFLGQNGLRGLKINVNLAPSSNVLKRLTGSATYTYELSNVKLIGQYYNPTPDEFSAGRIKSSFISSYEGVMRGQGVRPTSEELETAWTEVVDMGGGMGTPPYEYYSITSYIDSLNSNNSSHSLNLGLSQVRSVFMNWIPSSYINNFDNDGMVCRDFEDSANVLAPITMFKTSRAGVLFPCRFDVTTNAEGQVNSYSTNDRRSAIYQGVVNAVKVFYENHYQSGSYKNVVDSRRAFFGIDGTDKSACKVSGLGVNFSNVSNVGVDFSFSPFQFEIQTKLSDSGSPVNHTLYIFAINKNTLIFQNNNVRVLN